MSSVCIYIYISKIRYISLQTSCFGDPFVKTLGLGLFLAASEVSGMRALWWANRAFGRCRWERKTAQHKRREGTLCFFLFLFVLTDRWVWNLSVVFVVLYGTCFELKRSVAGMGRAICPVRELCVIQRCVLLLQKFGEVFGLNWDEPGWLNHQLDQDRVTDWLDLPHEFKELHFPFAAHTSPKPPQTNIRDYDGELQQSCWRRKHGTKELPWLFWKQLTFSAAAVHYWWLRFDGLA